MTNAVSIAQSGSNNQTFRNRIINGAMTIDQRNAGASVSAVNGSYTLDRYVVTSFAGGAVTGKYTVQQNAGSVTPPVGFTNYLGVTSSAATSVGAGDVYSVTQPIEGLNIADLNWGTANAQPVTISFWVRSSLTGTFGGALNNDGGNYNYPFTYSISAANTWEQKSVTITGPTAGTWLTTNGVGVYVRFGLGAGVTWTEPSGSWTASLAYSADSSVNVVSTSGATWYITGVQLEEGTAASPFENRLITTELTLCQRYYFKVNPASGAHYGSGLNNNANNAYFMMPFPVTMRTSPTALEQTGTAANYSIFRAGDIPNCTSVPTFESATPQGAMVGFTSAGNLTLGQACIGRSSNSAGFLAWSAEL
jgi:hypothetical protein